ncbi:hypothetical protein JCM3263A_09740 [Thermobifida fusca]|uniref:hypothetical protein n=1 Tax=Thermobifida TaxID=83677 RepID=UPI0002F2760C|nr:MULTISPECIES: hypothetical protein [Thermobifida]MBO2528373.1 hypothetical protein [Thermobifida sp.]MDD6791029.1 hypothetical protein [Thermobifida fusca]PZN65108.1 MAG: hypothetical protein DIU53_04695 [Thermobifida fusca]QOS57604.1 hypothetical protein IM867_09040 [Thermobifida fusca]
METLRARCEVDDCEWCAQSGVPCRCCGGSGQWRPERPKRDPDGVIGWIRVVEMCRMCGGTGKEHNPL